jgi:hypothetical protein
VYDATSEQYYTQQQLFNYVAKQDAVAALTEKAIVPSFSANTDMATSYIIQLNTAENTISQAKNEYNDAALKVKSPLYVRLPVQQK